MPLTLQQATVHPCLCQRFLDTHGQVGLSLLWGHCSFFLGPGAHRVLCRPGVCFLQKFCNPVPLAFKGKFPGGSQSLCWIPRLGNLLCTLELSEQCENFFDVIVLQIVCWVALWWGSQATPPRSAAGRAQVPTADPC